MKSKHVGDGKFVFQISSERLLIGPSLSYLYQTVPKRLETYLGVHIHLAFPLTKNVLIKGAAI